MIEDHVEKQRQAAAEEYLLWFVEEHLAAGALQAAGGDRDKARSLLHAAIRELGLDDG